MEHLLSKRDELQGDAEKVIKEIEVFKGNDVRKRSLIKEELHKIKPQVVVELGSYIGYTAIVIAVELQEMQSRAKVHSFDTKREYCEAAKAVVELAGLQERVIIHEGSPDELVEAWQKSHIVERVNFILLNHNEGNYLLDLRALESLGLINPGTTVIADDCHGDYIKYVDAPPIWRKKYNEREKTIEYRFTGKWGITYSNTTRKMDGEGYPEQMVISKCTNVLC